MNGQNRTSPQWGAIAFFASMFAAAVYFSYAAVQGDYGVFRRVQLEADLEHLKDTSARIQTDIKAHENLTERLSDSSLDLDLLDEQARDVLGVVRSDEVVLK